MDLVEYPDQEIMAMAIANKVVGELSSQLKRNDTVTLVVPGGSTPELVFDMLSGAKLDWDRVKVLPTNERWMSEEDARPNIKLAKEHLLRGPAAAAQFIPLYVEADTPEETLGKLIADVEGAMPVTVAIVGMGTDMHTAGLYPGAENLHKALADNAPSIMVMRGGTMETPQISMTPSVLCEALSIHVVITGAEKRLAVEKARKLSPERASIAALLRGSTVHWAA